MLRRLIELVIALISIFFLAPVFLLISIIILILDGRPIFFIQDRVGRDGVVFKIYKFRTMSIGIDPDPNNIDLVSRVTVLGSFLRRSGLDELPELLNVINGSMSFIGPRPLLVDYVPLYSDRQSRRHEIRPGITGLAQVNGRNKLTWRRKFQYDVFYVDHSNLYLNCYVLVKTVSTIFSASSTNHSDKVVSPRFIGS